MRILGVVLAGGASARFGADKTAAILGGKTLLRHVCERASSQVDRLIINRNEKPGQEPLVQYEVIPDEWPGEGPLAGIVTALEYAASRGFTQLASFPCDTPFFPADLVSRLGDRLATANTDCCMAKWEEREQRTLALWKVACVSVLKAGFLSGIRSLRDVPKIITTTVADFLPVEDAAHTGDFLNINTQDDLAAAARSLALRPTNPHE
jgi:molybdopterin-guanine dinucleotide biosynthesis protein A